MTSDLPPHRQILEAGTAPREPRVAEMQVAAIIPALNEEASLGLVLRDLPRRWVHDVIVVDNGSTDRTAAVARAGGARVVTQPQRGYGAACLAGIAALGAETEVVVFLDANYSDDPRDVGLLVGPILEGRADFVLGSRTLEPASRRALLPQQRWGNRLATLLLRWLHRVPFTDLGPFRAMRRSALDRLGMRDRGFGWTVEMQVKAAHRGLRILEVPVRHRRRVGRSKISGTVTGTARAGFGILYAILASAVRR